MQHAPAILLSGGGIVQGGGSTTRTRNELLVRRAQ